MRKPRAHTVLLLFAMTLMVLMGMPGISQAHVKAKYRADYKARLADITNKAMYWADDWSKFEDIPKNVALKMQPLVGDPTKHDAPVALEEYAGQFADTYMGQTLTYRFAFDRPVNAFKARAKLYFSTLAAQNKFKAAVKRLGHGRAFTSSSSAICTSATRPRTCHGTRHSSTSPRRTWI
jgi:hypothetical protein